jgi:hypothetical protein
MTALAGVVIASLLAAGADPHSMPVLPEKLTALDTQAGKIARDVVKLDRAFHEIERASKARDAGTADLNDTKAALNELRSGLEKALADLRAMKASKDGVTVDQAKAMAERLSALEEKVLQSRARVKLLVEALHK